MSSISAEVAALRGTKPATLKDLVTHPAFSKLMAAMTVSSLGDWVGFVAVSSLVASLGTSVTAASFAVAGVMIARMAPSVIFGPIVGSLVDRYDRKKLMIFADIGRGFLYALMPFLGQSLPAIFALSFLIECLSLMWTPARDASLPNLVPRRQLANANSIGLVTTYGTLPLGGAVFAMIGVIVNAIGSQFGAYQGLTLAEQSQLFAYVALWLDAGSFIFSAFMVSRLPALTPPSAARHEKLDMGKVGRDIVDGVKFLGEHPLAGAMTTGIVIAFSGVGAVLALGPVFVQSTLNAKSAGWGVLVTAYGIGMFMGLAAVNPIGKVFPRERLFYITMISGAVILFLLSAMPTIGLAATFAVLLGIAVGMTWVTGYTLLQESVADEFRGRTFASLSVLSRLGLFLSLTVFPVIAGAVGAHAFDVMGVTLMVSGPRFALMLASGMVLAGGLYTRRGMRKYRRTKAMPLNLIPKLRKPPPRGVFIVLEGVEGAGKGTQLSQLADHLESLGRQVLVTREPGGTPLGEQLREILLSPDTGKLEPKTEALLFAAARTQLVSSVIRPALEDGKVVICDRYIDSSVAYQGFARGLGEHDVLSLNVWATQGLFPDLVLLLHVEPEEGLARAGGEDRIEAEGLDFHAKVADAYLQIASEHPERCSVIDASEAPERVFAEIKEAVMGAIPELEEDEA